MSQELHIVLGTGPAGTSLARELLRRGHVVRTVDRTGDVVVEGAQATRADLTDAAAATEAVDGASVVYHCANVAYELQVEVMPRVQAAVLGAVEAVGARLVVTDTLYPYGPTGGEVMTEQTPWRATAVKGRMRADLDRAYLAAHEAGRAQITLGRAADFFGPGVFNSSLGATAFPPALTGEPVLALGDIDLPHNYSFILDVAAGLATLGERPEASGRVWHLPTAPAITTREVHDIIATVTGRPLTVDVLDSPRPWGPLDEAFMAVYAELFYQYTEPQVMDSSAFEAEFGVRPTPLAEALRATVEWYTAALSDA